MADSFIIESNTKFAVLKFNGAAIVIGQQYPLAQQNLLTISYAGNIRRVPLDSFTYSIIKNNVKSQNISKVTINFPTILNPSTPINPEVIGNVQLGSIINITDYMPYEPTFDRVVIKDITGRGRWDLENAELVKDETYFYLDIKDKLKFIADSPIPGNNYARMKYARANEREIFDEENLIQINIPTRAGIYSSLDVSTDIEGDYTIKRFYMEVQGLNPGDSVRIFCNIHIENYLENPDNKFIYISNGARTEIPNDGITGLSLLPANENGMFEFFGEIHMKSAFMPGDDIEFIFVDINGEGAADIDPDHDTLIFNL